MSEVPTDRLLTTQDVADKLRLHVESVRRLAKTGQIAFVKTGSSKQNHLRFRPEAVDAYIAALEQPAVVEPDAWGRRRRGRRTVA